MKRFPLFFTIISALAAFVGIFREDFGSAIEQAVEPTQVQTFADLATQAESLGKVFVCDYSVQAVEVRYDICDYSVQAIEERYDTIKVANFSSFSVTDRYHQDKPYRVKFPGKKGPPEETLIKLVPAQEKGGKVVAIAGVERMDKTCKIYDFTPVGKE